VRVQDCTQTYTLYIAQNKTPIMRIKTQKPILFLAILVFFIFYACSEDEVSFEDTKEVVEKPEEIDPNKIVTINTSSVVGPLYNFWSTRPMVNQTRFNSSNFTNGLDNIKSYVKNYNLVRVLGGRTDNLNTFYKGVDGSGNIITDFRGLLTSMRNFMRTGFKPRIVLDNVPWAMNAVQEINVYGNTNPPDNYDLWRQYIAAFLQTLIDEFGYDEVKTWRFRVGTEPNYAPQHWNGTARDYFKHYDITVDEVLKLIPDAIIGPGNMLTEGVATFTTELIEHCAKGTNYATGKIGTQMDFFSISYYEKMDQNTVRLENVVAPYRAALNSYSQFADIPLDIHEFGILRDEKGVRGVSLTDATEFGASWYATIADLAYKYGIHEIYDWGQEVQSSNLPQGRKNVTKMFQMMEDGNRVASMDNFISVNAGVIPVVKNNNIYLLVYNHNTTRNSSASRVLYPKIVGGQVSGTNSWKMNEWTVDKNNGVFMHQLYEDIRTAGVNENFNGRIYGNRPSDRFAEGWKTILNTNLAQYEQLAELPQTITDSIVQKMDDNLTLKINLAPHSVKLIELIPQ